MNSNLVSILSRYFNIYRQTSKKIIVLTAYLLKCQILLPAGMKYHPGGTLLVGPALLS